MAAHVTFQRSDTRWSFVHLYKWQKNPNPRLPWCFATSKCETFGFFGGFFACRWLHESDREWIYQNPSSVMKQRLKKSSVFRCVLAGIKNRNESLESSRVWTVHTFVKRSVQRECAASDRSTFPCSSVSVHAVNFNPIFQILITQWEFSEHC